MGEVEALAARRTIIFAKKIDLTSIILEGDCKVLVSALQSEEQPFASEDHLIAEARTHAESFHSSRVSHICIQGNFVAYNFTKYVRHVNSLVVWMENVLLQLNNVLIVHYDEFIFQ